MIRVARDAASAAPGQRLDTWLWAARFFKTRGQAKAAINAGHVLLNAVQAKPSKTIGPGDRLHVRKGEYHFDLTVVQIQARRVSPTIAQTLYRESEESIAKRKRQQQSSRAQWVSRPQTPTRPDKRSRGRIRQFKRGED